MKPYEFMENLDVGSPQNSTLKEVAAVIKPITNLKLALSNPSRQPVLILSIAGHIHLETQQPDPFPQTSLLFTHIGKTAFSGLSAFSGAGSRRFFLKFFCISIIHPKKNVIKMLSPKISIHYSVYKSFHNDIFCLVKYCHPLQWEKFTNFSLIFKWNIAIIETIITNNFPLGYTHASHSCIHILIMFSLCRRLVMIFWLHSEYACILHDKNVSAFVRGMLYTQRKIVSKIFRCNLILFLCSGKYRKNVQRQVPKDCVFNVTNILPLLLVYLIGKS